MQPSKKSKIKHSLPSHQLQFEAIGTWWQIDFVAREGHAVDIEQAIQQRIDIFDRTYSRFRTDSWVADMAKTIGAVDLPADARPLFDVYQQIYVLTGGAVTPMIGQVLEDAGYDANYSLVPGQLQTPPDWKSTIQYDSLQERLYMHKPALLDFGAAGKGYAVDIVCALLDTMGCTSYCVDAGGDIRQQLAPDADKVPIGLEDPNDSSKAVGIVRLGNGSVCGSATNRRQWAGLHHIIDPHTLRPVRDIKAVWVTAPTALVADAMTTCLFFTESRILRKHFDFEYIIMYADNSFFMSPDFAGELFVA
jgi:FAD:protein FMN transferase